jgi:hypothetical protein
VSGTQPDPSQDPLRVIGELPGVFEAVEAARGSVDALLRDLRSPQLRRRTSEVTSESLRRSAWASAALESTEAVALGDFAPPFADSPSGWTAGGALRVSGELMRLPATWRRAPAQAIARLHSVAGAGVLPEDELGRPRRSPGVAERLAALASLVTAPTDAAAVAVAAVVLAELLVVEPFAWGNGMVARGAARLVLLERGLDPVAASIPEQGLVELSADSPGALAAYRSGTPGGVAAWVVHYAQAVAVGARAGRAVAAEVATSRAERE